MHTTAPAAVASNLDRGIVAAAGVPAVADDRWLRASGRHDFLTFSLFSPSQERHRLNATHEAATLALLKRELEEQQALQALQQQQINLSEAFIAAEATAERKRKLAANDRSGPEQQRSRTAAAARARAPAPAPPAAAAAGGGAAAGAAASASKEAAARTGVRIDASKLDKSQHDAAAIAQNTASLILKARALAIDAAAKPTTHAGPTNGTSAETAAQLAAGLAAGHLTLRDPNGQPVVIAHTLNLVGGDVEKFAKAQGKIASDFDNITQAAVSIDSEAVQPAMMFISGQNAATHQFNCPIRTKVFISMAAYRVLFPDSLTIDFVLKPSLKREARKTKTQISTFVNSQFKVHPTLPLKTYPLTLVQCAKHTTCTATAVGTGANGDGGPWCDPALVEVRSAGRKVAYQ